MACDWRWNVAYPSVNDLQIPSTSYRSGLSSNQHVNVETSSALYKPDQLMQPPVWTLHDGNPHLDMSSGHKAVARPTYRGPSRFFSSPPFLLSAGSFVGG